MIPSKYTILFQKLLYRIRESFRFRILYIMPATIQFCKGFFRRCDPVFIIPDRIHRADPVISAGYKRQISWKEKDYAKGCSGTWGLSAWSDTEGQAVREGNVILFADNRAWNKKKKTEIRKNACMLELFGDEKVLKVLFALQELTAAEPDRYASAEEIAKAVKTETAEAEKILSELPVSVQEEERYRIEGYAAWIPAILAMIH